MDSHTILDNLISYACLVPVISCHEFAHAWVADKCGDNTPRMQGRVTLNPLAHMDLIGTVILPLLSLYFTSMIFGWGRPVYVNPSNFRERRRDDTLVSLAGPGMNFLMAAIAIMVAKIGSSFGLESLLSAGISIAWISLLLAFFNLIPIPPLDGSHVVKNLILMKDETYLAISQYGMLLVIIAIQIPMLNHFLSLATIRTLSAMAAMVRLPI